MGESAKKSTRTDKPSFMFYLITLYIFIATTGFTVLVIYKTSEFFLNHQPQNETTQNADPCANSVCRKYVRVTIDDPPNSIAYNNNSIRAKIKVPFANFPSNKLVIFTCESPECSELRVNDIGLFDCVITNKGTKISSCRLNDVDVAPTN